MVRAEIVKTAPPVDEFKAQKFWKTFCKENWTLIVVRTQDSDSSGDGCGS
jgi:hypothetical protein